MSNNGKPGGAGFLSGVYFLTVVGAIIYFIQHSETFWGGFVGFFKGIIWPLLVTYKILEFFKL